MPAGGREVCSAQFRSLAFPVVPGSWWEPGSWCSAGSPKRSQDGLGSDSRDRDILALAFAWPLSFHVSCHCCARHLPVLVTTGQWQKEIEKDFRNGTVSHREQSHVLGSICQKPDTHVCFRLSDTHKKQERRSED